MFMQDYKNLKVWQSSFELVADVYKLTKFFPKEERYGLSSQMQRAVVSIPSNIAEGAAKDSQNDLARFLDIALGSAFELECQIMIARSLQYINEDIFNKTYNKIELTKKMLYSFIRAVLFVIKNLKPKT